MSNLGGYQLLTTMAKRVGGPTNLKACIAGAGILAGAVSTKGIEKLKSVPSRSCGSKTDKEGIDHFYTVNSDITSKTEFVLNAGDQFRVLEADGEAVLIEIKEDDNNPYFVSGDWLELVSDYKKQRSLFKKEIRA